MPRNLPGTIKREAPPGPEMTEAEFRAALETQTADAARWRWLRAHWSAIMDRASVPTTGGDFQHLVDKLRSAP